MSTDNNTTNVFQNRRTKFGFVEGQSLGDDCSTVIDMFTKNVEIPLSTLQLCLDSVDHNEKYNLARSGLVLHRGLDEQLFPCFFSLSEPLRGKTDMVYEIKVFNCTLEDDATIGNIFNGAKELLVNDWNNYNDNLSVYNHSPRV